MVLKMWSADPQVFVTPDQAVRHVIFALLL
jgi:hypothetical protein